MWLTWSTKFLKTAVKSSVEQHCSMRHAQAYTKFAQKYFTPYQHLKINHLEKGFGMGWHCFFFKKNRCFLCCRYFQNVWNTKTALKLSLLKVEFGNLKSVSSQTGGVHRHRMKVTTVQRYQSNESHYTN